MTLTPCTTFKNEVSRGQTNKTVLCYYSPTAQWFMICHLLSVVCCFEVQEREIDTYSDGGADAQGHVINHPTMDVPKDAGQHDHENGPI